jgi:putative transposase
LPPRWIAITIVAKKNCDIGMELQRNSHHVFRIMYQFVWIPKYRHKVFEEPYRETLKKIIEKIGYDYNIEVVELEIPVDHNTW